MKTTHGIFWALILSAAIGADGFCESKAGKAAPVSFDLKSSSGSFATLQVGASLFTIRLYDNASAKALEGLLPLEMNMIELHGNEKYHRLPQDLPANARTPGKIRAGELMLFGSDCLVLFYKNFTTSYAYTKLGFIEDVSGLGAALGRGNAKVTLSSSKKKDQI